MARPKKETAERHTARFPTVRCTTGELATLKSLSAKAGMTLSDFVRQKSLKGKVVINKSKNPVDFSLINELNKIGVNLNQLTKMANIHGEFPNGISTISAKLEKVLDKILLDKEQIS